MLAVVLKTDRNTLNCKKQKGAGGGEAGGVTLPIYISVFGSGVVVDVFSADLREQKAE